MILTARLPDPEGGLFIYLNNSNHDEENNNRTGDPESFWAHGGSVETMKTYNLTIAAPHGLHIRVAAKIVELVRRSEATVRLFNRHNRTADGGSIISLMTLGLAHGHPVRVEVEGRHERAVADRLAEIFNESAV